MQSRYYNPSWGRFINADALIGQTGELLGHNMFAYCKNNAVNRKDDHGFLSSSVLGEGGEGKSFGDAIIESAKEVGKGTTLGAGEELFDKVTIYKSTLYTVGRKGAPKVVKELTVTAKNFAKVCKLAGGISTGISIADNFSGRYSTTAALVRSLFDVGGFVTGVIVGAALVGSGGVVIVGVGIGIAVVTETVKLGATYFIDKKF